MAIDTWWTRGILALAVVMVSHMGWEQRVFAEISTEEQEVKATYVYRLIVAVEWSYAKSRFRGANDTICLRDPQHRYDPAVFDTVAGKEIEGRTVRIRSLSTEQMPHAGMMCDVLYVTGTDEATTRTLLGMMEDFGVVTVSDAPGFARLGGMVEFVHVDRRIRMILNKTAIEKETLRFPAQVYDVAHRVLE